MTNRRLRVVSRFLREVRSKTSAQVATVGAALVKKACTFVVALWTRREVKGSHNFSLCTLILRYTSVWEHVVSCNQLRVMKRFREIQHGDMVTLSGTIQVWVGGSFSRTESAKQLVHWTRGLCDFTRLRTPTSVSSTCPRWSYYIGQSETDSVLRLCRTDCQ